MAILSDGSLMPFGTPGGDVQIQTMLQVVLNVLRFGMEGQDAIEAPRVASYSFPSSFAPFDYFPDRLSAESRIRAARETLSAMGHKIADWPAMTWLAGCVEVIKTDPAASMLAAGADPRPPVLRYRELTGSADSSLHHQRDGVWGYFLDLRLARFGDSITR